MKKLLFLLCTVVSLSLSKSAQAQFVTIPDANFVTWLTANYPTCMIGNQMDTTCSAIVNETYVDCSAIGISDLTGIQYFSSLDTLICHSNQLSFLPALTSNLIYLDCSYNWSSLDSLYGLPNSLVYLDCSYNLIYNLPSLPSSLKSLDCSNNQLSAIPNLPSALIFFSCIAEFQLSSLPSLPNSLTYLDCSYNYMNALPALPSNLSYLSCKYNQLTSLPAIPNSLTKLYCNNNQLTNLPSLSSSSLTDLFCENNLITSISFLPNSLSNFNCSVNTISSLPSLPSLHVLICSHNLISSLPTLPNSLWSFDCSYNFLNALSSLPSNLNYLTCDSNQFVSLPTLPITLINFSCSHNQLSSVSVSSNALQYFDCSFNQITSLFYQSNALTQFYCNNNLLSNLPSLSINLHNFNCNFNQLTSLPNLPNNLQFLYCSNNQLTSLPYLPNGMVYLICSFNLISQLPNLPQNLLQLACNNNPSLNCLPLLPHLAGINFSNCGVTCIPNYPPNNPSSIPALTSLPLCNATSGCPFTNNISGFIHVDTSLNCLNDSLNPGIALHQIKVQLLKNGLVKDQMYVTNLGLYSFDVLVPDTLQVKVDTAGLPIYSACPSLGLRNELIVAQDTLHYHESFGMKCAGIDLAVGNVYGRFRPNFISVLNVNAGDISQLVNMNCANGASGVLTITINGPVSYVSPAVGALTPSSVLGNTITYNVSNFGQINFGSAFNTNVYTAVNAIGGTSVCISVHVTTTSNDINHSNDSLTFCTIVFSSYDPNEKEVYPDGNLTSSTWLTYTINFQNTGNDTAFGVIVRDTLSQYLDEASFAFLAASHNCVTQLFGSKVVFSFPHINLVDSFTNEPLSHGWVQFKIRLKNNCPSGVNISNRSSIYFDSNLPVLTNSTMNHFCLPNSSAITAAICQGEIYHFGGAQLTVAGNYTQHYINAGGCDSAVNLHLTVDSLATLIAQNGDSLSATSNGTIQWLDCNTMQIVATGNNFVASSAGDYAVIATNGSCVDTSACLHVTSVDGFSISDFGFRIYPNPASDELNILFSKAGNYTVKITDEIGREILSATSSIQHPTFNIQHLSSGIYFVSVKSKDGIATEKFVKE